MMMKNVNILTIHKEPNYGAVLQAYALYKTIKSLGHTPHIINLSLDYKHHPFNLTNRILLRLHKWFKGYSYCFDLAEKFNRKYCPNQIGDFHTLAELEAYPWDKNDYYLIGSDQVWNPEITQDLKKAFCFSFLGEEAKNRYSYAASFGSITDEQKRKEELDFESLSIFRSIAVREKFGVDFLKKNGINAVEVIDPTLLIDDYSSLLPRKVEKRNEILFLSLSDTQQMNEFVDELSSHMKLPVRKHYGYLQPEREKNKRFMPVEEWLYSIASARLVVTDSFHATVFSIIFNRPFLVYLSEPSKGYRITNLFHNMGIERRIVDNIADALNAIDIDYSAVNEKLATYRQDSISYLQNILQ